ncbi:unnamed protein product, partial [Phaeothamnion confervicola]
IGVYVRDSFDFNGSQIFEEVRSFFSPPLGSWKLPDGFSKWRQSGYTPVGNADFRRFREVHDRGEDLQVYSNIKFVPIGSSVSVPV